MAADAPAATADKPGSRAATPVLPPITPEPGAKDGGDAAAATDEDPLARMAQAAAEDAYLGNGFTKLTINANRVIEKLNAIGVEAGMLPLPNVPDPETCVREAEKRQARKDIVRRRQLLERYERNREQMLSIREELGCPEDADPDESENMYSADVVEGLRASLHSMRRDLRKAEKERIRFGQRIDGLEAERDRAVVLTRAAEERLNTTEKLLRTAQKRERGFVAKEHSFKAELTANNKEDRASDLGQTLSHAEQKILKLEAEVGKATKREKVMKTKIKTLNFELAEEKARMERLLESPNKRKIEEKIEKMREEDEAAARIQAHARGATARRAADVSMRAATFIQAEVRKRRAVKEMKRKAKEAVVHARECFKKLSDVQDELNARSVVYIHSGA